MNGKRRIALGTLAVLLTAGIIGAVAMALGGGGHAASTEAGALQPALGLPSPGGVPPDESGHAAAGQAEPSSAVAAAAPISVQPRIVKSASIRLEVRKGAFADRFQEATLIAGRYGGFVTSSSSSGTGDHSGNLVIRVPAASFERALADLRGLGTVKGQEVSGADVTAQFVDLQARLRNWEAQESVLLGLMRRSRTIDDSIKVQRQLQDVQLAIEQIRGELRVLSDQADLATVSVSLTEAGAPPASTKPSIGKAWRTAVDGGVAVIAAVVVGLGYLIPIGLLAFVLWVVVRRFRPRGAAAAATRP